MGCRSSPSFKALVLFLACFLAASFARQGFLYALFLAGLQVEGVTLNLLDNVFLLHFALEATQCIFEGLTLLNSDFRQLSTPPNRSHLDPIVIASLAKQVKGSVQNSGTIPRGAILMFLLL